MFLKKGILTKIQYAGNSTTLLKTSNFPYFHEALQPSEIINKTPSFGLRRK